MQPGAEPLAVGSSAYRPEIDALRAIAVLAVIAHHDGYLASGFLGGDVFFAISGYLITGLLADGIARNRLSFADFYVRRIRRIVPLSLVSAGVALAAGTVLMLPDDLENLSQSVVATNLFANNVLLSITSRNYFDVVNDYKPLMHTWSLGLEEQYYVLYPLLFLFRSRRAVMLSLVALMVASIALSVGPFANAQKFYHLPFRFDELAIGGVAALALRGRLVWRRWWSPGLLLALVALLTMPLPPVLQPLSPLLVVCVTAALLILQNDRHWAAPILRHRVLVGVGVISYSLYMWHQLLIAYARYAVFPELRPHHTIALFAVTVGLSVLSYRNPGTSVSGLHWSHMGATICR